MNVQQIVDRILEFGLDETDADNSLETRILNDVNEVYKQVQNKLAPIAFNEYGVTEDVTVTSGVGTVTDHLYSYTVFDKTNKRFLDKTTVLHLEEEDPELITTGSPNVFYITGLTTINTYPIASQTLRFRYYPLVNELLITDLEGSIRVPVHLHNVLVEGGNYLTSLREQGFHDRLDRGEKLRNWLDSQAMLTGYILNKSNIPKRVKYHD